MEEARVPGVSEELWVLKDERRWVMQTRRISKLLIGLLLTLVTGVCSPPSYGALVGHYDFAGTSGGNVTDTVSGRNLTGYKWSSLNPADYFQLWSGTIVARIVLSPFSGGWTTLWELSGETTADWDKVGYGVYIPPDPVANFTPYRPNMAIGVRGNGDWRYLNDDGPQAIPTGQPSTVITAWNFDAGTANINAAIWIDGVLRGASADLTPDYYPGYNHANNYRLNSIDLSQFTRGELHEVWVYDRFVGPAPASLALLGLGGVALLVRRRRRAVVRRCSP